ncbi:MAG: hypothetical protein WDN26_09055 [Chitinophagaceae bacterium]
MNRLIIVLISTFSIAFTIGKYFDHLYKKKWQDFFFDKIQTALSNSDEYDILFIGNSKIHSGINPWYVDSITHLSSYNLAIGGGDEQEIKLLSTLYLQKHHAPKVVVFGIDGPMLQNYHGLKDRYPFLYFLNNDTVAGYMKKNGFPTTIIKYFPFIKYSFFDEYNRISIVSKNIYTPESKYSFFKGFINAFPDPSFFEVDSTKKQPFSLGILPQPQKINDTSAATIKQITEIFMKKGTRMIFLFLPGKNNTLHDKINDKSIFDSFFLSVAAEYKIPVMRLDTSSVYLPKYFADNFHVNMSGSKLLSIDVSNFILENITQNKKLP